MLITGIPSGRSPTRRPWASLAAIAALVACLAVPGPRRAYAERLPGEYLNDITANLVTPHVPWAKHWAQGKLRVFFITPFNGAAREVAEVWQRADIEVFGETTPSTYELGRTQGCFRDVEGTAPEEKAERLALKLTQARYDVFVVGNVQWTALPPRVQYLMLKQVADGAGLVVVFPQGLREELARHPLEQDREWIAAGVPLRALPFFADSAGALATLAEEESLDRRVVTTYAAGKGRVALLDYGVEHRFEPCTGGQGLTPPGPFTFASPTYYEYYTGLVLRVILWAGAKTPDVRLALPTREPLAASTDTPTSVTVALHLADRPPAALRLAWTLKDRWGEEEGRGELAPLAQAGRAAATLDLPPLKAGVHFLDLLVDSERGREDWGTMAVVAPSPVELRGLAARRVGEGLDRFALSGEMLGEPPTGTELEVTAMDNYDRVLGSVSEPLPPGRFEQEVKLPTGGLVVSRCLRLRARLVVGPRVLAEEEVALAAPRPVQDEYPVCMWGMMPGYVGHLAAQRLRELGFNLVLGAPTADFARNLALHDLGHIPYCTRLYERPNFTDAAGIADTMKSLAGKGRELGPYRPHVYSLGDENAIPGDLGVLEEDRPFLREFLRERYGDDLTALNEAWGTQFTAWEAVEALSSAQARETGKFTAYHDLMCFREQLYAQRHKDCKAAIQSTDPEARVGAEGSEEGDLELTTDGLDFWGPYRQVRYNTLLRSVAPRDLVRGNWFGGYRSQRTDPRLLPEFLWSALFDGNNLIQYFALATLETLFTTDYSLTYYNQWYWDDFQAILDGPAQLSQRADYDYDAVALLHSQASVHMNDMEGGPGRYAQAHTALLQALGEAWLQHYYVTDRHPDDVNGRGIKLLFLPCGRALSDEVCAALRRFVEAGGVLVADVRPAVTDEHCRAREASALADLFGVRMGGRPAPVSGACEITGEVSWSGGKLTLAGPRLEAVVADGSVATAAGKALGTVEGPVVVCNPVGQGLAVLLNFGVEAYETRPPAAREPLVALVRALSEAAGVTPLVRALGRDGRPLPDCRLARFRYGDTTLHGVLLGASHDGPTEAVLRFAGPAHLYDTLAGAYLGRTDQARLRLEPGHGRILCALPEKLESLRLQTPRTTRAGTAMAVRVGLSGAAGRHLVRLHAIGPDGARRRYYDRSVTVQSSRGETVVPFAVNDAPGQWTLEAHEVATGVGAKATVELMAREH